MSSSHGLPADAMADNDALQRAQASDVAGSEQPATAHAHALQNVHNNSNSNSSGIINVMPVHNVQDADAQPPLHTAHLHAVYRQRSSHACVPKSRSPLSGDVAGGAPVHAVPFGDTPLQSTTSDSTLAELVSTVGHNGNAFGAPLDVDRGRASRREPMPTAVATVAPRKLSRIAVDEDYAVKKLSCREQLLLLWQNLYRTAILSRLLIKLSWIDIKRRVCAYFLAFISVLLVVMMCTVLMSVLGYMPLTLLDIADNTYGRIDLELKPGGLLDMSDTLNYTLFREKFPLVDGSDTSYHFPRWSATLSAFSLAQCTVRSYTLPYNNNNDDDDNVNEEVGRNWWSNCQNSDACVEQHCRPVGTTTIRVFAINDQLERRAGITGDTPLPPLDVGTIVISREAAAALDVREVGEHIVLYGSTYQLVQQPSLKLPPYKQYFVLELRVSAIVEKDDKKFNLGLYVSAVNFDTFLQQLAVGLSPEVDETSRNNFVQSPMDESANEVHFLMPPAKRQRVYGASSFDEMRHAATVWAMPIIDKIGYNQLTTSTPTLKALQSLSMLTMMLSMAFTFVILGLAALCTLLIYSMLRVGVSSRTYSTGIQRMIGFTRENTVALLFFNVYMFAIPGWIVGIILGQVLYIFVGRTFKSIGGINIPTIISASAVGWATLAAMVIPFLAACLPMYSMIRLRLSDALNVTRQHASMVVYKIVSARGRHFNGSYFGLGAVFAVVCALLYYYLPAAFLNNNLTQMLILYVVLLCCMIIGLVFIMLNFQRVVEVGVAYILLFWESSVVFHVMLKNLNMHRSHNTLTTVMYALSIAFMLFVTVMFSMQLDSITSLSTQLHGGDVVVQTTSITLGTLAQIIAKARAEMPAGMVVGVAYASINGVVSVPNTSTYSSWPASVTPSPIAADTTASSSSFVTYKLQSVLRSIGRYKYTTRSVVAVSPTFFEVADPQFLDVRDCVDECNRYGIAGALYVPSMRNRVVMSSAAYDALALDGLNKQVLIDSQRLVSGGNTTNDITFVRTAAVLSSASGVQMSRYQYDRDNTVISLPLALAMNNATGASVMMIVPHKVVLRLGSQKHAARVKLLLSTAFVDSGYNDVLIDIAGENGFESARDLLNKFLLVVEVAVLAVCLISLLSSMMTNVLRSSKEIGILLSIGMTHFQIYRVYIWEAFVLVVSSGVLGIIVGVVVGYTMQMQMSMTTQQVLKLTFPYLQVVIMVGVGFLSAVVASLSPVRFLLGRPSITSIINFYQE